MRKLIIVLFIGLGLAHLGACDQEPLNVGEEARAASLADAGAPDVVASRDSQAAERNYCPTSEAPNKQ